MDRFVIHTSSLPRPVFVEARGLEEVAAFAQGRGWAVSKIELWPGQPAIDPAELVRLRPANRRESSLDKVARWIGYLAIGYVLVLVWLAVISLVMGILFGAFE